MYLQHFGLAEKPFAITPDPRYLFLGTHHSDAMAHLAYGIKEAGGFIQLTGEVGTGKTTTIRALLARNPDHADIALIINPKLSPLEFLQTICEEFGLGIAESAEKNAKDLVDHLNRHLLKVHAAGRRAVLIVDEAQGLTPEVLEQVRLLTNLETASQKLLQIILIGQPELRELLARPDLRQLAQRVTARFHLNPLNREECSAYVRHRLRVAGATHEIFHPKALSEVYRCSGGVPRVINVISDRALLGAYTTDQHKVGATLIRRAADEVFDQHSAPRWVAPLVAVGTVAVIVGGALAVYRFGPWSESVTAPAGALLPTASASPAATPTSATAIESLANPPLRELLATAVEQTSADVAFGELFKRWQLSYQSSAVDGCVQAQAQHHECVSMRGSLAQLRAFNRPAILMLSAAGATQHQVLLVGLDEQHARIRIGLAEVSVGIAELTAHWYGDFLLLWMPPSAPFASLAPGARGPAVSELRARLQSVLRRSQPVADESLYDAELQAMVRDYQARNYLDVDGIAGRNTQMLLDAMFASAGTPVLRANRGG